MLTQRAKAAQRLTDTFIRKALSPATGQRILWDTDVKGFGLRITSANAKAFILDYRTHGRQRRITIGTFPSWGTAAARKIAAGMRKKVDLGSDPMGDREAMREAPTLYDVWERYETEYLPQKAHTSQKDETSMWKNIILPKLGKTKLIDLESFNIDELHKDITKLRGTPVRANRVIASLRKALNLAIRWDWIEKNPANGVRRNPEERRTRYLNKKEIGKLAEALAQHSDRTAANAIKLLMLTGARKSEVTSATWDMFDLDNGIWTKPSAHTKQRKLHRVPLNAPALNLLKDIKRQAEANYKKALRKDDKTIFSPFVFPSAASPNQPIKEIRKTWNAVCKTAGLIEQKPKKDRNGKIVKKDGEIIMIDWPNVRIHDLRHSFASILVSAGASLPLIGQMLGHTQVQTTQRYAHLYDDPLRKAANMVGDVITAPSEPEQIEEKSS